MSSKQTNSRSPRRRFTIPKNSATFDRNNHQLGVNMQENFERTHLTEHSRLLDGSSIQENIFNETGSFKKGTNNIDRKHTEDSSNAKISALNSLALRVSNKYSLEK